MLVCIESHGNHEYVGYFHSPLSIFQDDLVSLLGMGWEGVANLGSDLLHPWQLAWLCN